MFQFKCVNGLQPSRGVKKLPWFKRGVVNNIHECPIQVETKTTAMPVVKRCGKPIWSLNAKQHFQGHGIADPKKLPKEALEILKVAKNLEEKAKATLKKQLNAKQRPEKVRVKKEPKDDEWMPKANKKKKKRKGGKIEGGANKKIKVEKEDKKRKGIAVDGGPAPKKLKVEPTVN